MHDTNVSPLRIGRIFQAATPAAALITLVLLFFPSGQSPLLPAIGLAVTILLALAAFYFTLADNNATAKAQAYVQRVVNGDFAKADVSEFSTQLPELGRYLDSLTALYKDRLGFSRSILDGLPNPCCIVDPHEKITFLNQECLDMLGIKEQAEAYHSRMISQVFYKDDRKSLIGTAMDDDQRFMNREAVFKHADGSDVHVLINLFPLHDVDGKVIGGCCVYVETTQIKLQQQKILDQNDRIATAAREAGDIATDLSAASVQLGGVVQSAREGTRIQTERTSETATSMNQMNATVLEVARNAQEAATDASAARDQAEQGATTVTEVITSIEDVTNRAEILRTSMVELDHKAEDIGNVLGVIEDIADQTNLLALNAAIEAARAGEAGRGFAVVADEVRKLAEKTMQATGEVHTAIRNIQEGARNNVLATEAAVESVSKTTELAGKSGDALSAIVAVAEATADRVHSIATAAEEQSAASEQINAATLDVTRVCGETDELMVEAEDAINRLSELAHSLSRVIQGMQ